MLEFVRYDVRKNAPRRRVNRVPPVHTDHYRLERLNEPNAPRVLNRLTKRVMPTAHHPSDFWCGVVAFRSLASLGERKRAVAL